MRATLCGMARLNLTLSDDTLMRLVRYAEDLGIPRSAAARQLLQQAIDRLERIESARKLAADYTAGRPDSNAILSELEAGQFELLDDEYE